MQMVVVAGRLRNFREKVLELFLAIVLEKPIKELEIIFAGTVVSVKPERANLATNKEYLR